MILMNKADDRRVNMYRSKEVKYIKMELNVKLKGER